MKKTLLLIGVFVLASATTADVKAKNDPNKIVVPGNALANVKKAIKEATKAAHLQTQAGNIPQGAKNYSKAKEWQEEIVDKIQQCKKKKIPLDVCIKDSDDHKDSYTGSGTGYGDPNTGTGGPSSYDNDKYKNITTKKQMTAAQKELNAAVKSAKQAKKLKDISGEAQAYENAAKLRMDIAKAQWCKANKYKPEDCQDNGSGSDGDEGSNCSDGQTRQTSGNYSVCCPTGTTISVNGTIVGCCPSGSGQTYQEVTQCVEEPIGPVNNLSCNSGRFLQNEKCLSRPDANGDCPGMRKETVWMCQ